MACTAIQSIPRRLLSPPGRSSFVALVRPLCRVPLRRQLCRAVRFQRPALLHDPPPPPLSAPAFLSPVRIATHRRPPTSAFIFFFPWSFLSFFSSRVLPASIHPFDVTPSPPTLPHAHTPPWWFTCPANITRTHTADPIAVCGLCGRCCVATSSIVLCPCCDRAVQRRRAQRGALPLDDLSAGDDQMCGLPSFGYGGIVYVWRYRHSHDSLMNNPPLARVQKVCIGCSVIVMVGRVGCPPSDSTLARCAQGFSNLILVI